MNIVERKDLPEDYLQEMMKTESHHNQEIVRINGVLRWKANPAVVGLLENISLNDLCPLLCAMGFGKNSEVYRKLYRDMGYSLRGYWEVFYWEMNNYDAADYVQPIRI